MRALAKSPADRFASAREFVEALDAPVPPEPPAGGAWWRRRPARLVGAVLVGVFVYLVMQLRPRLGVAGTDSARLVIAPFNVVSRDSALVVWREGIVDVLSTNLADVGPVSAVPPTVADAYWPDHADATSTAELARQTGARFGVYGTLTALGGDSVRVTAVLLDVRRGGARTLRDFQWETPVARLTTLTDSLSHGILVALDRILPVGAVTGAWLGTHTSGPALNEFVRGEHAWRRSDWGTAIEHYERALAVDSTFAPALHRVAAALGWQGTEVDSVVQQFRRRAAAHNHGLPVRESLLVVIDSLSAAVADTSGPTMLPSTYWRLQRRIFATLKEGARRFPNDPELIDQLGDRRYHYAFGPTAVPAESILANFDRAIALDSGFAPTYLHATELGLMLGGDTAGLRYAQKYLTLNQADISATNELMTARLVQAGGLAPAQLRVDTASRDALIGTRNLIDRWADTAETAIALDRVIAARFPVEAGPAAGCATQRGRLAWRLAYRGRLREAWCALGTRGRREQTLAAEIAFLGAMPADSVAVLFAQWEAAGSPWLTLTHPWYAERHDSAALRRLLAAAERRTRADSPADRQRAAYDAASARAYLALVHGDSAQALRRFAALPDTLCYTCSRLDRIVRARLLAAAGRLDAAHEILSGWPGPDVTPLEGLLALERARVARRLGNTAEAQRASELVRRLWIHADSPWRERANRAQ
jgi:TolB-like protein